ncbi:MAG: sugar-binding domain-containing protein [Propionicimonas sp.]|uniref:sugar-binding transcriptional regulator n=1 Tax=Propionicimonas sp. TaxID=1955623 RepID=UPI002B1EBC92|nr:sugar-binding domain-containing protein [Propionicimonas sp.]MEA4943836.1 sugar-binding domain-containing protein [Propionicimonas sp.]MEA5055912.1 sugar-binding domain-containing protein [Propionicimonas sp.]
MARKPGLATLMLAATISRRFYIDGESKTQIAEEFGLSRFQIARLLDLARAESIVTFTIDVPGMFDAELSEAVRQQFGLRRVIVTIGGEHDELPAVRRSVGKAAAALLAELVTDDDVLGVAWGRTLSAMSEEMTELARCPVIQMVGAIGTVHENSLELVRRLTSVGGGRAYPLYVPLLLEDEQSASALRRQAAISAVIQRFESITIAAAAIGSWSPPDSQLLRALSPEVRDRFLSEGIIGDVCATLLRDDGSIVEDLQPRSIAIHAAQLRRTREVVVAAGGAHKARAVRAAIRAKLCTTLVTDSSLARALLDLEQQG